MNEINPITDHTFCYAIIALLSVISIVAVVFLIQVSKIASRNWDRMIYYKNIPKTQESLLKEKNATIAKLESELAEKKSLLTLQDKLLEITVDPDKEL
jgi:hypothetical protein